MGIKKIMKKDFKGFHLFLLHISALLFGGTALFSKFIPLSAIDIIVFRSLFSGIILFVFLLLFSRRRLKVNSYKDAFYIVLSGLCFGIHLYTYFESIQVSSIGIGVISLFTFPIITTILEPLLIGTKPQIKDILLGILVLLGVLLIVSESNFKINELKGVGLGILSAFTYSIRNLIQKYRLTNYSPIPILFYQFLVTYIILIPNTQIAYYEISTENYMYLFLLCIVFTIIPHLAVIESLKKFDARSVGVILTLQVLYAITFAFLFFHEELKPSVIAGSLIVLFVVSYESVRLKNKV